jgi:hypothetical protein
VDGSGVALDREQYGYDRNGNRLYAENGVNAAFSELYQYDNLNQLSNFQRGTLNGTKTAISGTASRSQVWDFDALGNMDSVTSDGVAQTRSANKQNEITSISGSTTPTYDASGNMTADETGKAFNYDAWGRVIAVNGTARYAYDGANRRIQEGSRSLYYSASWQVVEERRGGGAERVEPGVHRRAGPAGPGFGREREPGRAAVRPAGRELERAGRGRDGRAGEGAVRVRPVRGADGADGGVGRHVDGVRVGNWAPRRAAGCNDGDIRVPISRLDPIVDAVESG